ncbi:methyltransferase FkbM family [Methanothermus fervidus DSM 2088]|uniref:Methyltransferase FkbM family n=1 Tax=Methanothermus fervidus (strain ATCC 43054 / DSM 2088 / JCM 10308 / V24 S) TaxID=523846 RepID=E3GW95_METFV|nr:FkbM family methyltransferase [Methanothermus fervidus]ADP77860.1 methyltransferase FkbM family [Methanothermus fervidus DSM 2088]
MIKNLKSKYLWTKLIFKATKDPLSALSVLLFRLGLKDKCKCAFKYLGNIELDKNDIEREYFDYLILACSQKLSKVGINNLKAFLNQRNNKIIEINGIRFLNSVVYSIYETFVEEQYRVRKAKDDETVIDIGGNIGDTALYFASKGYKVYAFEPIPEVYKLALKNINLNKNLADRIKFINKAVSSSEGEIKISYDGLEMSGGASAYTNGEKKIRVKSTTIEKIIDEYNVKPYLLKMDCEGCEYEIIKNSDLSMFKEIIFEYHRYENFENPKILIDKLRNQGFKVKSHKKLAEIHFLGPIVEVGIVHMVKNSQ